MEMQPPSLEHDATVIINSFARILSMGRKIMDQKNLSTLDHYYSKTAALVVQVADMNIMLRNLSDECNGESFELRESTPIKSEGFNFVYKRQGDLRWGEISEIEQARETLLDDVDQKIEEVSQPHLLEYKDLNDIESVPVRRFRLPITPRLNTIPNAIYWYGGDRINPPGAYTRVGEGLVVKVPFPNVVDGSGDFSRIGSIRCKYGTLSECFQNKKFLASRHRSMLRECTFAHTGDMYRKIGMNHRAQEMPGIGTHATFQNDIEMLSQKDAKTMLMYALSDLLICNIWSSRMQDTVFTDVDTCQ
jgi:hypothetical protein